MKVEILEQVNPERNTERVARIRALFEGGAEWEEHLDFWLPQNQAEPDDLHQERKKRAVYHNHVKSLLGLPAAYLFGEDATITGLTGEYWEQLEEDADANGHSWSQVWSRIFIAALQGQDAFAWINAPERDPDVEVSTRADEDRLGLLNLYIVPVTAEECIDWGTDKRGALTWVLFRQVTHERGDVVEARKPVWRWTAIDAESIRQWEWKPKEGDTRTAPDDEDEALEVLHIPHNMGGMPVVRLRLPAELWAGNHVHDPAVAHLRGRNDLEWALHRAAHAMPVLKTEGGANGSTPLVGAGYYWHVDRDDDVAWAEPGGSSFQIQRENIADLRDELYRAFQQMALSVDRSASQAAQSGFSKEQDWQALDIILAAYATLVRDAMRETLEVIARARGEKEPEISVSGLDGWQTEHLEVFLAAAAAAIDASEMSPSFRREVAKRQAQRILGPDIGEEAMKTIIAEIDKWEPVALMPGMADPDAFPPDDGDPDGGSKPPSE